MRTAIVGVFLLLAIVCIMNVESVPMKKRSLFNVKTNLEQRGIFRDLVNNDEEKSNIMFQRHLKSYAGKRMNKKSIFSWDLTEKQQACVNKCLPVPDAEFEDCYNKCNAGQ